MKIGQVIEQMLQCEDKEFKGELAGIEYLVSTVCGRLEFTRKSDESLSASHELPFTWILRDIDWEVVRPPVSFMEACNSGKMFKVNHELIGSSAKRCKFDLNNLVSYLHQKGFSDNCVRSILRDGEFFIVDENECDSY